MFVADPAFLADFGAETGLGRHDFLSLLDSTGQVLLSSAYSRPGVAQSPLMRPHAFEGNAGTAVLPANEFDDATRRIVAWQRLAQGGLTVVAGLSERNVLAVYQQSAQRHYGWAMVATLLLLVGAGAGLRLSLRRARRERRRAELSKTYSLAVDGAEEGFYTVRAATMLIMSLIGVLTPTLFYSIYGRVSHHVPSRILTIPITILTVYH